MLKDTANKSTPASTQFFEIIFGRDAFQRHGRIAISQKSRNKESLGRVSYFNAAAGAAEYAATNGEENTFFSVGLTSSTNPNGRGPSRATVAIPGVWVDIDCSPSGIKGKSQRVPSSINEALSIIAEADQQPTLIVSSGSGLHAYWLFSTPWYFDDFEDADAIVYGWRYAVNRVFESHGYSIDHVGDLARVLRVPGTLNEKYGNRCEIHSYFAARRYSPEDFRAFARSRIAASTDSAIFDGVSMAEDIPEDFRAKLTDTKTQLGKMWVQADAITAPGDGSQSSWDLALLTEVVAQGVDDPSILWALLSEYRETHCDTPEKAAKGLRASYAKATIAKAIDNANARQSKTTPEQDFEDLTAMTAKGSVPTKIVKHIQSLGWELWRSSTDNEEWVSIDEGTHVDHFRLRDGAVAKRIQAAWWDKCTQSLSREQVKQAVATLTAIAARSDEVHATPTRVAEINGRLYVDLATPTREAVEIHGGKWRVIKNCPVRFRRMANSLPLPMPIQGGRLTMLRDYVKCSTFDFSMIVGWLVGAYHPSGPYPLLTFSGEMGAGKSTILQIIRGLVDPHALKNRTAPREERDLYVAARGSYVVCFDNLTSLPGWLSDGLCRLATGGGLGTRRLFSDDDEIIFTEIRPTLIGSIGEVVSRSDLSDRTLSVKLNRIPADERKTEKELWAAFNADAGLIMGGLMDAVAASHAGHETVNVDNLHRMADWHRWAAAAMPSVGLKPSALELALDSMQRQSHETVIEASPEVQALADMMEARALATWTGTATQLASALRLYWTDSYRPTANVLSRRLAELSPVMREFGWTIDRGTGRDRRSWIITPPVSPDNSNGKEATIDGLFQ